MPVPLKASQKADSKTITWKGIRLKSLETLEERSATGMDSERGVYVISVDALGSPLRDFFAPNDVILQMDGTPINRLEDMEVALKQLKGKKEVEFVLFRAQKSQKIIVRLR